MDPTGYHAGNKLKQDEGRIRETSEETLQLSRWRLQWLRPGAAEWWREVGGFGICSEGWATGFADGVDAGWERENHEDAEGSGPESGKDGAATDFR